MKYLDNFKLFESIIQKIGYDVVRTYLGEERNRDKRKDKITVRDLSVIYKMLLELGINNSFTKIDNNKIADYEEEYEQELSELKKVFDEGNVVFKPMTAIDRLWSTQVSRMNDGITSVRCLRVSKPPSGSPVLKHDEVFEFWFYKFEDDWWIIRVDKSSNASSMSSMREPQHWLCDGYDGLKSFSKEKMEKI